MRLERKLKIAVLFSALFCAGLNAHAEPENKEIVVRHPRGESEEDARFLNKIELLKLALSKTEETYGPFGLQKAKRRMQQDRALKNLAQGKHLDIVWTMTSIEREKELLPIRVPLQKGLLGHRIFIINKKDQAKFDKIRNFADLQNLAAGQGHDWPDTKILRTNKLEVVTSPTYEGLFAMLKIDRFDYFPRGVTEPWREVETHKDLDLVVEKKILLRYRAPEYFFVNKNNKQLAKRLEEGLRMAIEDGSFDQLFIQDPDVIKVLKNANLQNRLVFDLDNPFLPPLTPVNDKSLWLQIGK